MKYKICSVCQQKVIPPVVWWEGENACSNCIMKAAKEIQKEKSIGKMGEWKKTMMVGYSPSYPDILPDNHKLIP